MKINEREKGQVIVIIALAIVVLMGFTALAIDGSLIYSEKRSDQAAADSAALAGAGAAAQYLKTSNMSGFSCGGTVAAGAATAAINVAIQNAARDGITLAVNDLSVSGVTTACDTYNGRKYIDVHIVITTEVQPKFISVIHSEPIKTAAEAVARVYVNTSFAGGNAIYTTGTTCSETNTGGGVFVSGTGRINITGGGIYSSSCLSSTGSAKMLAYNGVMQYFGKGSKSFAAGSQTEYTTGNGLLFATNAPNFILNDPDISSGPSIDTVLSTQSYQLWSTITANPNIDGTLWPSYTTQTMTAEMEDMPTITCPSTARTFPTKVYSSKVYTALPGTYSSISWSGWGDGTTVTFTPGTYCVAGSVALAGGSDTVIMDNVVIYITGSGSMTFGGTVLPTLNNSTVMITNGNFNVASGITLYANNFTVFVKQGNFSLSGASTGLMNAPGCNTSACGVGPSIPGVLIYMGKTNTGTVSITGSGSMSMTGTVYAPNSAVYVNGAASAQTLNVQIIGKMVSVSGSGVITMNQTDANLYSQGSTTIQLMK
jgi:hypothetical protein